jgi:hypothetical protein
MSAEPQKYVRIPRKPAGSSVGVAKTKAQACIEVHNAHGLSRPVCTPFIGH